MGEYYRKNILSKEGLDAFTRTATNGSVLERKMVESQDRVISMQDGAPPHTAREAVVVQRVLHRFWEKDREQSGFDPIENLWSILQQKLDEEKPSTGIAGLVRQLKRSWAGISPSVLANLAAGMPTECAAVSLSMMTTWVNKNKRALLFFYVLDGIK